jgi:hypothetical protein
MNVTHSPMQELPPAEPIEVSLPAHAELALVGKVSAIVDGLVCTVSRGG